MSGLGEKIKEELLSEHLFDIDLFGLKVPVTDTVVTMWIVMAILIALAIVLTRNMKTVPGRRQNLAEMAVSGVNGLVKGLAGHHYRAIAPYVGTVISFLLVANMVSLLNVVPGLRIVSPTRGVNVTAAMALMSMLAVIVFGIVLKGPRKYAAGFLKPSPILLPFHILDFAIRPMSLCFRLFGNIVGAVIVMKLIYLTLPVGLPAALSIYFDIFDGALQAYVFSFLTTVYIAEAVEEHA